MKKYCYLFSLVCSLLISRVWAANKCETIFASELSASQNETRLSALIFTIKKADGVSNQSLIPFQSTLSSIKGKLVGNSTFLFAPQTLELRVSVKPINLMYSHGEENFIQFPLRKSMELRSYLKKPSKKILSSHANKKERLKELHELANKQLVRCGELRLYLKHPKYSLASVAHEFGHSIFHESMLNRSLLYRKRTESFEQFSKKVKESKERLAFLEIELEKTGEGEKAQAIESKLAELEDQLLDFQEKFWNTYLNDPYGKNESLIDGYNELFADLTSVLYFKDPAIMYKAMTNTKYLQYLKNENGHDPAISRDFTNRDNNIERWIETDEIHELFAPVRYFIFERFLNKPQFLNREPRKLYENVFNSILSEINFLTTNAEVNFSPRELNQRLIQAIEKSME